MLAVAGNFYGIASIMTVSAAILFAFFNSAHARWVRAQSLPFVCHVGLPKGNGAILSPVSGDRSDKIFVTDFVENAQRIFETAASADSQELESGEISILIGEDGAIRMLMGSDWPLDSLQSHHGAGAAYRVSRREHQVCVEGKSRGARCLLRSEPVSSIAKRLLADRPRYLLAA